MTYYTAAEENQWQRDRADRCEARAAELEADAAASRPQAEADWHAVENELPPALRRWVSLRMQADDKRDQAERCRRKADRLRVEQGSVTT